MTSTESGSRNAAVGSTKLNGIDNQAFEGKDSNMAKHYSAPKMQPEEANGLNVNFENPISYENVEVDVADDIDEWEESDEECDVVITSNPVAFGIYNFQRGVKNGYHWLMDSTRGYFFFIIFCLLYMVYFIFSMIYKFGDEGSIRLLVCTILGVIIASRHLWLYGLKLLYYSVLGPDGMSPQMESKFKRLRLIIRWLLYAALAGYIIYVLVDEISGDIDNIKGLPGFVIIFLLCLLMSARPHMIKWHTIIWSVGLQLLFAVFTLRYKFGRQAVEYVQDRIDEFFSNAETAFVTCFGPNYRNMGVAFNAIPLTFMASSVLTVLYYLGAMQFITVVLGKTFKFIMDTDYVESLSVAGGIFLDSSLSVLALRPYLSHQTKSQLFVIILSTISSFGGTSVAILNGIGIPLRHILAAMLISAPATFTVGKLMLPERRRKNQREEELKASLTDDTNYSNILDAFQIGALVTLPLIANVVAIIFSFLSVIDWISSSLLWFGDRIGKHDLTLDYIFSYLLYPVALAMGIRTSECLKAGRIIGIKLFSSSLIGFIEMQKLVGNRFIYYQYLNSTANPIVSHVDDGILLNGTIFLERGFITERTEVILTYGLSGLSSFLSVSILFAALYAYLPIRRKWLAKVAPVAVIGGNLANFMTGCLASIFYEE